MPGGRPRVDISEKKITISIKLDSDTYDKFFALNIPNKSELINELLEEHFAITDAVSYLNNTADSADSLQEAVELMKTIRKYEK
jgi:hypothetical protein